MNYTDIGNRIAILRKKKKMTQAQLAEYLSISNKHCSEVERGIAGLSLDRLIRIADLFHVSLDYLIRGYSFDDQARRNLIPVSLQAVLESKEPQMKELLNQYFELLAKILDH